MKAKSSRAAKATASKGKKKRKPDTAVRPDESATASLDPLRTGMPALDSITGVKEFRKGKKVYRIIKTDEVDEYETPPKSGRKK
jgi:hypothetical protein